MTTPKRYDSVGRHAQSMTSHVSALPTHPIRRAEGTLSLIGAAVLGMLLSAVSVFVSFMVFNFIMHQGS